MKKILYTMALAATCLSLGSCINDLDTVPLNETDQTAQQAYTTMEGIESGLAYIYGSFSLVSQNDPGSSDISVDDAGQSELMRQYVMLNEMSADALKCTWGDDYIKELQNGTWNSTGNAATIAVYTRCMVTVTRANEFLKQTKDSSMDVAQMRAEARFLRALANYLLMDLYGNPPYATEENLGGELPSQIGRKQLFENIENELLCISGQKTDEEAPNEVLASHGTVSYPRADKGSAEALLARMYLNAEVYTGTARWSDAMTQAQNVIGMGYTLCPDYAQLFMQDNGENTASQQEMIFAVSYDRDNTQSWGGTTHLVSASLDDACSEAVASYLGYAEGSEINRERWNGYHIPSEYVENNFDLSSVTWGAKSGLGYDASKSDKRAFFINVGCTQEYDPSTVATGWRCWKWTSRASDGTLYSSDSYTKFSSSDFPMFRLAEMYLIYAECKARLDGGTTSDKTAVGYVNALRNRAGVDTKSFYTTDDILKERACELMWEGHRRTDLIRYGYFTSASYPWPYKGGVPDGKQALPSYKTIFPLLDSDLQENSNLVQNPGYKS